KDLRAKPRPGERDPAGAPAPAAPGRYQREAEKARATNGLAEMRIALAQADQATARLELVRHRLLEASIRAPFDGAIVEGDLKERLAAPVKQGDALLKIARLERLYVEAEVNERDIHEILGRERARRDRFCQPAEADVPGAHPQAGAGGVSAHARQRLPRALRIPRRRGTVVAPGDERALQAQRRAAHALLDPHPSHRRFSAPATLVVTGHARPAIHV